MKKVIAVIMVVVLFFLTSGPIKAEYEIKNVTVVSGIGIDYDDKNNEFLVTVEILDVNQTMGDSAPTGNLTKVMKYRGKTVSSAIEKLSIEVGRSVIYSQKKAIVLGKSVLEKHFLNIIDFFIRDYKTRSGVLVAASMDNSAEDIIKTSEGNATFPSEEIQILLQSGNDNGFTTEMDMTQLINMYLDKCTDLYIPTLDIKKEGKERYTYLKGFVILSNKGINGELNLDEGRGLLFVNNKIEGGTLFVPDEKFGLSTFKIIESDTKIKTSIRDDKPYFEVNIKCVGDLIEQQNQKGQRFTREYSERLAKMVENNLENLVNNSVEKCLDKYNSDVFGLGRRTWIKYPKYFKKHENDFPKIIKSENVNVNIEFRLRRIGQGNS